jgi:hypothetical protein
MRKHVLHIVGGLIFVGLTIFAAVQMIGKVRVVDIILLFASGFGAGATTLGLVRRLRERTLKGNQKVS